MPLEGLGQLLGRLYAWLQQSLAQDPEGRVLLSAVSLAGSAWVQTNKRAEGKVFQDCTKASPVLLASPNSLHFWPISTVP